MAGSDAGRSDRGGELERARGDLLLESTGRVHRIDEPPFDSSPALDPFGNRAEDIREVAADLAFVDDARQSAGARQDAEQRRLRQADRRIAVVNEQDLVAGERELVSAARADAVDGGDEPEAGMRAGVFNGEPGFVGVLAEVHLPRVRRAAQHEDVRAGAEHALLEAGDDDGAGFGVLEAEALNGVGELDVDAEVVGVQLQPVIRLEATVLLDVHRQRGDGPFERQSPVAIGLRLPLEVDWPRRRRGLHPVKPNPLGCRVASACLLCGRRVFQTRPTLKRLPASGGRGCDVGALFGSGVAEALTNALVEPPHRIRFNRAKRLPVRFRQDDGQGSGNRVGTEMGHG